MVRLQGRVSKHQGGRQKARTCIEKVVMAIQGVNPESTEARNLEPPAESGSSLTASGASMQAEIKTTEKVVVEAAGIRQQEAVEGATTNPP